MAVAVKRFSLLDRYVNNVCSDLPQVFWLLDGEDGVSPDLSHYNRNGLHVGTSPRPAGVWTPVDASYVKTSTGGQINAVSCEMWVYIPGPLNGLTNPHTGLLGGMTNAPVASGTYDKDLGLSAGLADVVRPFWYTIVSTLTAPNPLISGWHQLVGTTNTSASVLYVDGVAVATGSGGSTYTGYSTPTFMVGGSTGGFGGTYTRQCRWASLYNYALSPGRVAAHYAAGLAALLPAPQRRYWVIGSGGLANVWNGSAWVQKPAMIWNGSAWVQKPVEVWTGAAWKAST